MSEPKRKLAFVVPTCERDAEITVLAVEGIRKFVPDAFIIECRDDDRTTERKVPDDIRKLCRDVPYLRKQIDTPFILDGIDDICILDSDCFVWQYPSELLSGYAYQGHTLAGNHDYKWGLNVWAQIGLVFEKITPLFCAGMFTAPRSMWVLNEGTIFEYLRRCAKLGFHDPAWEYSGVTLDQGLVAGLWRRTCKDNPLPFLEYPLGVPSVHQKIFHACYYKRRPEFKLYLKGYREHLDNSN